MYIHIKILINSHLKESISSKTFRRFDNMLHLS